MTPTVTASAGDTATIDVSHVAEVCRLAALAALYATRNSAQAISYLAGEPGGSGVTVGFASLRARRTAERALDLHGYRHTRISPGNPASDIASHAAGVAVRVTGWSPPGLERRFAVLTRTVARLENTLPATIAQAAGAYALLREQLDPRVALYGTADTVRADLQARITQRTGPLPRRGPAPHTIPDPLRRRMATIDELTQRVNELLAQHWLAAVHTAERFAELAHRHPPGAAQAKTVADMRTTIWRQRRTELFHDARTWAESHLGTTNPDADTSAHAHITAFASWYVTEFGPPHGRFVPFDTAARHWHAHGRPAGRRRTTGTRTSTHARVPDHHYTPSGGSR